MVQANIEKLCPMAKWLDPDVRTPAKAKPKYIMTSNGSWCMGIKGEMSGTVCVTFTWDMYIYELFIAFLLFVHYCNMMVCVVYCVGKWQGWGQFSSRIGIAAQWNWNWRLWNWNWKPELNFLQLLPQHLLVNQQFPNFSFNSLKPSDAYMRR